jgi:hypothetical protein
MQDFDQVVAPEVEGTKWGWYQLFHIFTIIPSLQALAPPFLGHIITMKP